MALIRQLGMHQAELSTLFPRGVWIEAPQSVTARVFAGFTIRKGRSITGNLWEQFILPQKACGGVILSLSNVGPLATNRGITMIHDAQAFTAASSYSAAFVRWYRFLLPRLGRKNLQVLTVSEFSKAQLVAHGVARAERITVIPNGVDHILAFPSDRATVHRLGLTTGRYVVALATTQPHKNIAVLLHAFGRPIGDLRLILVGKVGPAEMKVAYPHLSDDVLFTGVISDAELRGLLENALCFAMPSTTEGFGLPPLEAMILGTPAVVAPCGALPEVCGGGALYADPCHPEDWRAKIQALSDDPAMRKTMSAKGAAQAASFTWARAGDLLINTLRHYAQESSRSTTLVDCCR